MADEPELEELEDDDTITQKRDRSPSFPYVDLSTAIQLAKVLYDNARASEIRVADIAEPWGLKPKSGSFMRYVAALGQFDLIETSGSGAGRRIKISAAGRRILEDDRPGVRERLTSEAALKPKLIRELYLGGEGIESWGKNRPTDKIAESALKFDFHFGADAARRFLSVYDETIKHIIRPEGEPAPIEGRLNVTLEPATGSGDAERNAQVSRGPISVPERTDQKGAASEVPVSELRQPTASLKPVAEPELELNKIVFKSEGDGHISIRALLDADGLDLLEKRLQAFRLLLQ